MCYDFVQEQVPNKWRSEDNSCNIVAMIHVGVSSIAKRVTLEEVANSDGYNKFDVNGKCPVNGRYGVRRCRSLHFLPFLKLKSFICSVT